MMKKILIMFIFILLVGCTRTDIKEENPEEIKALQEELERGVEPSEVPHQPITEDRIYQDTIEFCTNNQPDAEDYEEHKICCDAYMKDKDNTDFISCETKLLYS